ncbi:hypothetical protein MJT46_015864 [Ovis ammon polii x Ovis aries]|nr:hypothetical protein MJT46_015864 [Ovis ammon polii x Ovis aries]
MSFMVKETLCPRLSQQPAEQCDFKENGLVKQCVGTLSLDRSDDQFGLNCNEDEDLGTRKPVSFTVKETLCPRMTQQPVEQCDFQEKGWVKQCVGTVTLDLSNDQFDLNCNEQDEDPDSPKRVSFRVKETVCPRTTQQPPEQCDFKENGLLKRCEGTVTLDQVRGNFDITCNNAEDRGARKPVSFKVKETVCPRTSQQPAEQCDFRKNGVRLRAGINAFQGAEQGASGKELQSLGSSLLPGLSLVAVSRGYSLVALHGLLIEVASLIVEHSQKSNIFRCRQSWGGNIFCVQSVGEAFVQSHIHQTSDDTRGKALNT